MDRNDFHIQSRRKAENLLPRHDSVLFFPSVHVIHLPAPRVFRRLRRYSAPTLPLILCPMFKLLENHPSPHSRIQVTFLYVYTHFCLFSFIWGLGFQCDSFSRLGCA
nr:hypothetical protein Iba_chr08eCG9660 [Ipomoea batatas]GMD66349.1 hypothetical protein Iba_scaffold253294CG0010 [Ipomoea batatas]